MLEGRVVVITHARHFVGPVTARVLAGYGATVVVHDAEGWADSVGETASETDAERSTHGILRAKAAEPEVLVEEVIAAHGRIDALICNDAHPADRAPVDEADPEAMRAALAALVEWPYRLIGRAVPHMKAAGAGRLLMVTSAAPLRGLANYSIYATARGAGNALVRSLSLELARFNIQVNAVAPNYIETPTYFPPELVANETAMAKMLSNIPLKRLGRPEEVAETIAFLASDRCGFITGHVVPIAGGWV